MLNPKKKIFEQIQVCTIMLLIMIIRWTFFIINFVITSQPDLKTNSKLLATYRGIPLSTDEGGVTVKSLSGASIRWTILTVYITWIKRIWKFYRLTSLGLVKIINKTDILSRGQDVLIMAAHVGARDWNWSSILKKMATFTQKIFWSLSLDCASIYTFKVPPNCVQLLSKWPILNSSLIIASVCVDWDLCQSWKGAAQHIIFG